MEFLVKMCEDELAQLLRDDDMALRAHPFGSPADPGKLVPIGSAAGAASARKMCLKLGH